MKPKKGYKFIRVDGKTIIEVPKEKTEAAAISEHQEAKDQGYPVAASSYYKNRKRK